MCGWKLNQRRYYRRTHLGGRVLAAETKRMRDLVRLATSTRVVREMNPV